MTKRINAKHKVDNDLFETIKKFESYGVGELMINSKDRDGIMNGFDCDLIKFI